MAPIATSTRRSPSDLVPSPYIGRCNDHIIDHHRMPEPHRSNRRKRSAQPSDKSLPAKRSKVSAPSELQPPPAFWDNLSTLWLTKRALRELDRRNVQAAQNSSRGSVTRNFSAERQSQPIAHFLRGCNPRTLKDVKTFARRGGPDLSDLRNVRVARHILHPI